MSRLRFDTTVGARVVLGSQHMRLERGLPNPPWRGQALRPLLLVCILAIAAIPFRAGAHGELLIRIGQLTRQLATNGTAQLYLERGELYREDRNWTAAEADYARAAELGYPLAKVDFCRAKLLADQEKLAPARQMLDKVIESSDDDGEAFVARARALVRLGERKSSFADFERGAQLLAAPEAEVFLDWAHALADEGNAGEALERLDQGIARGGPSNLLLVYALELELRRNNLDGALARLAVIIEHVDRKERWLAQRGDIERAAGRAVEARKSYEAALSAIKLLPVRLQKNPPMQSLTAQINSGLTKLQGGDMSGGKSRCTSKNGRGIGARDYDKD